MEADQFFEVCPFRLAGEEWVPFVEERSHYRWMRLEVRVRATMASAEAVMETMDPMAGNRLAASVVVRASTALTRLSPLDDDVIHLYEVEGAALALQFISREDADALSRLLGERRDEAASRDPTAIAEARRRELEDKGFAAKDLVHAQLALGKNASMTEMVNWIFDTLVDSEPPVAAKKPPPPPPTPTPEEQVAAWAAKHPVAVDDLADEAAHKWSLYESGQEQPRRPRRRAPPPPPPSKPPPPSHQQSLSELRAAAKVQRVRKSSSSSCLGVDQHLTRQAELAVKSSFANAFSSGCLEDFSPVKVLGSGAFSRVLLVQKEETYYAMKVMKKQQILEAGLAEAVKVERDVLRVVQHPFLVRLRFAFQTPMRLYLVTDFYACGSLDDALRRRGRRGFGVYAAKFLVAEIALGLSHLHSQQVLHRDVKAANVLLDARGHAHLADFGLAKRLAKTPSPKKLSFAGTLEYMAPETIGKNQTIVDIPSDWWAVGCLLAEIAQGFTPFRADSPRELMANIIKGAPRISAENELGPVLRKGFLVRDPAKRLADLAHIANHPFFRDLDLPKVQRKALKPPIQPEPVSTRPDADIGANFRQDFFDDQDAHVRDDHTFLGFSYRSSEVESS